MSLPTLGSTTLRRAARTASFVSPPALLPPKSPIGPHYTERVRGGQATRASARSRFGRRSASHRRPDRGTPHRWPAVTASAPLAVTVSPAEDPPRPPAPPARPRLRPPP